MKENWSIPILGILCCFIRASSLLKIAVNVEEGEDCLTESHLGNECQHFKDDLSWPKKDCFDDEKFYDCVSGNVIQQHQCLPLTYGPRQFDEKSKRCVARSEIPPELTEMTFRRYKRQGGSITLNGACRFNTDCITGGYCNSGLCTCLSNYISDGSYCYMKISPGGSGCTRDRQCTSVWPNTACTNGQCVCSAVNTQVYRVVETRDGPVCVANLDECPLPFGYGSKSILSYVGTNPAVPATCTYGSTTDVCMSAATSGYSVAELYDCILRTGTTTAGVCCPNRAFTCTQKMETGADGGTTGASEVRYHYNSITDTCDQFTFYVSGSANANNFGTLAQCESYCKDRCPRGNAQYQTQSTTFYQNNVVNCQGSVSTCSSNYQCTSIGSSQICCSSPSFICSTNGGLVTIPPSQTTPYNPGYQTLNSLGNNIAPETRYYYDSNTRTCQTFSYLGVAGNYNNFRSQAECLNFCAQTVCDRGSPLIDTNGLSQVCSSTSCPTTHTCTNGVCCPSKQTVCSQDLQQGTACSQNAFSTRWWYNPATRQCQTFTFGGCNGNENNFETQTACLQYCSNTVAEPICQQGSAYKDNFGNFYQCNPTGIGTNCPVNYECYYDGTQYGCCPTKTYTCALPSAIGRVCGPQTTRWYYDTTTGSCTTFIYSGCDGNSNNFPNRELCENYCGTGNCPNNGSPYTEAIGSPRICSTAVTCPAGFECSNVVLSTTVQVNYCCPTRASVCALPPLSGNACGSGSGTRYYFSQTTRGCATFTYNGCGGNANNFASLAQCQNFCNSAGCNAGESVYINPTTSSTLTCDTNNQGINTCPSGYTCRYDSVTRTNVCCGSTDGGVCPNGERAYIDSLNQTPRQCTPSSAVPCPGTYLCRLSTTANGYYCCAPISTTQCPNGFASYLSPITNLPQVCNLGSNVGSIQNTCPPGYSCQTRVIGSFQGYCCSVSPICPTGFTVYQTTTGRPQSCNLGGINSCPPGYQCQTGSFGGFTGYCCSSTSTQAVCPSSTPYLLNNSPVVCNPQSSTNQCPGGYSCQLYTATNTYYCCAGSVGTGVCQNGTPYVVNNVPRTCDLSVSSCPTNYVCQRSTTGNLAYCCSGGTSTTVCGANAVPYQPGGVPVSCTPNDNRCPSGYNCQLYSATNTYYCCQPTASFCPSGQPSLLNGVPQTCNINGVGSCSAGYVCTAGTNGNYYCCSGGTTGTCPNGGAATARTCSPNVRQPCGGNELCQFIAATNRYQCCTSGAQNRICPNGGTSNGVTCSPTFGNTCGVGSSCQLITATGRYECCTGFGGQQTCSNGGTITPTTCSPNFPNSCGNGLSCQLIPSTNRYQCCTTNAAQGTCPQGGTLTGNTCSPSIAGSCSFGATCQLIAATGRYQCCTGALQQARCPNNAQLYREPSTNQPRTCSFAGSTGCPFGYSCQSVSGSTVSYCCQSVQQQIVQCPAGQTPLTSTFNGQIQFCTPNSPNNCPGGYRCTLGVGNIQSASGQSYLCCTGGVTPGTGLCASGNAYLYPGTNSPLVCQGGNCPAGYTCQQSTTAGRSYCCRGSSGTGSANGCPAGFAYISPFTRAPQTCVPGGGSCPAGYFCSFSSSFRRYQCCSGRRSASEKDKADSKKRIEPDNLNVTKPEGGIFVPKQSEKPRKMCLTGTACNAGEYGCKKKSDCLSNLCEEGRCACPSNMLISHNGRCVKSCGNQYVNQKGECVLATSINLPFGDSSALDSTINSGDFLEILCSNNTLDACGDKMSYCNTSKQRCQCYATYEVREGKCVLSTEYRKNADKKSNNDKDDLKS